MDIQQIILVALSALGVFHGILVSVVLWNHKSAIQLPNRLLSILMIILSLRIGKSVILEFYDPLQLIYVYLGLCLLMFIGPLFFLYSKKLVYKIDIIDRKDMLHFIPGIFFMLLAVLFNIIGFKNLDEAFAILLFIIFYSHLLFYLAAVKIKFLLNSKGLEPLLPEVKEWLNTLFCGFIAIWLVYVLNLFEENIPYIIGPVVYSATVYVITYLAISKKYIQFVNSVKYKTTSISKDEVDPIFNQIERMMKDEKLFLNTELNLGGLSKILKVSPQKISLVINSRSGNNFNEYINRYRIEHAVKMIDEPGSKALTIASISYDSGFNSLSSFNVSFKKYTGKTPSAYRQSKV